MRRPCAGRLTALAPSRTLLEGFDKGSRAVLATASRGSPRRARGPGVADRIGQEGDAFADDPTAFSPVLVAQLGLRGGLRRWRAGVRTRRTGHRRSMSAVHMPHKTCRCVGRAALREPICRPRASTAWSVNCDCWSTIAKTWSVSEPASSPGCGGICTSSTRVGHHRQSCSGIAHSTRSRHTCHVADDGTIVRRLALRLVEHLRLLTDEIDELTAEFTVPVTTRTRIEPRRGGNSMRRPGARSWRASWRKRRRRYR